MKKLIKILIISLIGVCLVAIGVLAWIWCTVDIMFIQLPAEDCPYMFECEAEELFDKDLEKMGLPKNLLDHAWVSREGNLVLLLNAEQRQAWINSPSMDIVGTDPFIEVTPNYKQITVHGYEEYVMRDAKKSFAVARKMLVMQVLVNRTTFENAKIRYILDDGKTGRVFFMALLPDDPIDLKLSQWKFSYYEDYDFIFEE